MLPKVGSDNQLMSVCVDHGRECDVYLPLSFRAIERNR